MAVIVYDGSNISVYREGGIATLIHDGSEVGKIGSVHDASSVRVLTDKIRTRQGFEYGCDAKVSLRSDLVIQWISRDDAFKEENATLVVPRDLIDQFCEVLDGYRAYGFSGSQNVFVDPRKMYLVSVYGEEIKFRFPNHDESFIVKRETLQSALDDESDDPIAVPSKGAFPFITVVSVKYVRRSFEEMMDCQLMGSPMPKKLVKSLFFNVFFNQENAYHESTYFIRTIRIGDNTELKEFIGLK